MMLVTWPTRACEYQKCKNETAIKKVYECTLSSVKLMHEVGGSMKVLGMQHLPNVRCITLELASVLPVLLSLVAQELEIVELPLLLLLLVLLARGLSAAVPSSESPDNTSQPLHTAHCCGQPACRR